MSLRAKRNPSLVCVVCVVCGQTSSVPPPPRSKGFSTDHTDGASRPIAPLIAAQRQSFFRVLPCIPWTTFLPRLEPDRRILSTEYTEGHGRRFAPKLCWRRASPSGEKRIFHHQAHQEHQGVGAQPPPVLGVSSWCPWCAWWLNSFFLAFGQPSSTAGPSWAWPRSPPGSACGCGRPCSGPTPPRGWARSAPGPWPSTPTARRGSSGRWTGASPRPGRR